jgi:hypothetical protein
MPGYVTLISHPRAAFFMKIIDFPQGRLGAIGAENVKDAEYEQICRAYDKSFDGMFPY